MEHKLEHDQPLQGMRILVADDEFLIAVCIEEAFSDSGAEVVTVATLPAALKCASDEPLSAAVLDVRLGYNTTESVADILATRGVPFIFYTGQALPDHIRMKHPRARVLVKPSKQNVVVDALLQVKKQAVIPTPGN